jgi:hypothetical protein
MRPQLSRQSALVRANLLHETGDLSLLSFEAWHPPVSPSPTTSSCAIYRSPILVDRMRRILCVGRRALTQVPAPRAHAGQAGCCPAVERGAIASARECTGCSGDRCAHRASSSAPRRDARRRLRQPHARATPQRAQVTEVPHHSAHGWASAVCQLTGAAPCLIQDKLTGLMDGRCA